MIAWMVAGQGAEHPGMGVELAHHYLPAAELWGHASDAAQKDLLRLSEAGGRALLKTEYLQPALTAVALGAASFLRDGGVEPEIVLGHSAGEVAALALAGRMPFEHACGLSAERGRSMSKAARERPGGMAAVRGSAERLCEIVEGASSAGAIFAAGQTTEDTHLMTGERAALRSATTSRDVSPLSVSGPWHSPLMRSAADDLRPLVESLVDDANCAPAWVSNQTGEPAPDDAATVSELLLAQLTSPMKLHASIERMLEAGVSEIVVLGPHHALSHILRRHLGARPEVRVHRTSSREELEQTVRELR